MSGCFITFEGGEGSGKSTQIRLLAESCKAAGIDCVVTREPGGSAGAEKIRNLLVSGEVDAWDPVTETLLFYAARLDHVSKCVKPALAEGKLVLCDRFSDSTMVYQGVGKHLSAEYIRSLHHLLLGNFAPDMTLILDIDPMVGLARAQARRGTETRFESMDIDFHHAVRSGFLEIARKEPTRCAVIDASQEVGQVHSQVIAVVSQRIGASLRAADTR